MKTKICDYCKQPYQPLPENFKRSKFCSRACRDKSRITRVTKTCEQCGNTFEATQSTKDRRFCSTACAGLHRVTRVKRVCETCGKTFEVIQAMANTARHCSKACQTARVEMACTYCGTSFYAKRHEYEKGLRQTCSRSCQAKLRAQEGRHSMQGRARTDAEKQKLSEKTHQYFQNNPDKHNWYVDGSYVAGIQRRGPSWQKQRKAARARDNYTCRSCGKTEDQLGRQLSVHHIKPYRLFASSDEANALDNLVCVCQSCHWKIEHGSIPIPH